MKPNRKLALSRYKSDLKMAFSSRLGLSIYEYIDDDDIESLFDSGESVKDYVDRFIEKYDLMDLAETKGGW